MWIILELFQERCSSLVFQCPEKGTGEVRLSLGSVSQAERPDQGEWLSAIQLQGLSLE